jgi:thiamine monophosphate synthase
MEKAASDGMMLLDQLVRFGGIPLIAIGGIVPQHIAPLRKLGVRGVAAIRGIWDSDNAERAAADYLSAYDAPVGG